MRVLSATGAVLVAGLALPAPAGVPEALPGAPPFPKALLDGLERELAARGVDYEPRTRQRHPDGSPRYTNRLLLEASPYLQQHAHNPVNWYPWGQEAFEAARQLDRPVLVSIGYSTCHWCHVMEDESFDEPEIARLLNTHFIAVKVDREMRPDVDAVYMSAIHALGQGGGWPLNVWVTPDRKPFFAGTYFPPKDRGGRPGLPSVLQAIHEQYSQDRNRITDVAERLSTAVRSQLEGARAQATSAPDPAVLRRAFLTYAQRFDPVWGGAGNGQKFPSTLPIRFLLRYHRRSGDPHALEMATRTLEKMAAGGIHDHIGGGFHRYATERRWLIPHFEKMLYDNALRVLEYLEAWQVTGRQDFAQVARRTLDYVAREMTAPGGAFYSATDADSRNPAGETEEGWFFTWTPAEIDAVLDDKESAALKAAYAVTAPGNLEGRNVLHVQRDWREIARDLDMSESKLHDILEGARARLYLARLRRPPPLRDEKILAAWNGLMLSAFARAGFAFDESDYTRAAVRAADFVLDHLRRDGRLLRVHQDGRAAGPAFLEDYAFVVAGLLDLYEAEPDPRWLRDARALQQQLDAHYADADGGGYYETADDQERLLAREKPGFDGALPSGNSVAASNLLRLAEFTGDDRYADRANLLLSAFHEDLAGNPTGFSELLLALDYQLDEVKEIVLVAPVGGEGGLASLLAPLRGAHVPNRILAVVTEGADLEAHAVLVPLVSGKVARGGRATAYVCENRVCLYPTSDPAVFTQQIHVVKPLE